MEKITLHIFWIALMLSAGAIITVIWFEEKIPEFIPQTTATLFIVGFGSFLIWASLVTYRFLEK